MTSIAKILQHMRREPANIRFSELRKVCEHFFGPPRQQGSSHLVFKPPPLAWRSTRQYSGRGRQSQALSGQTSSASHYPTGAQTMSIDHYTYRVTWSPDDNEHVCLCVEFPSLSWLAESPEAALSGIRQLVAEVIADLKANNETVPEPLAEKHYSGEFRVRIPPELHRQLALLAAEQGISLNRLASAKLAGQPLPN
jgi:predicted HicB family RNase H-like nuclease